METIKVKYFTDIDRLEKIVVGDWIDLRCAETTAMQAGEYKLIPLGIAMELPRGYEALVASRSSTFRKYGVLLANSLGVIDESYKGDNDQWHFLAYATRDTVIPKNERICQFRIYEHQPQIEFIEVEHLGNPDRGGIGSTDTTNIVTYRQLEEGEVACRGKKYRVRQSPHFDEGTIVVAVEDDSDPYCVPLCKYLSFYSIGDYKLEDLWSVRSSHLEEVIE